jgi:hypothetical protein
MKKPIDLYLDEGQLASLGLFSAYWTYLETELDFTITAMSHHVTGSQRMPFPFDDRMDHWRKMIAQYPLSNYAKKLYRSIIVVAHKAHDRRSKFLHGRVVGDPRRRTRRLCFEHHRHRQGNWSVNPITIEPRELRRMARIIGSVTRTLISLNRRYLKVSPQSLPNTFPAPPRDDPYLMRRGHSRSSAPKGRRRPLRA